MECQNLDPVMVRRAFGGMEGGESQEKSKSIYI